LSLALTPMLHESAAALLRERTGLVLSPTRLQSFERYLADDMRRRRTRNPERYLARLAAEPQMFDDLVTAMTVGETYFFRDPRQLEVLKSELVPTLQRVRPHGHRLRFWSAGCATGEEAYTLSIIARDAGVHPAPTILGTDISRR